MSTGQGAKGLLPMLLAGGAAAGIGLLLSKKSKNATPVQSSASAVNGNIDPTVPLTQPPDAIPLVIPDAGGVGNQLLPPITGIQNVLNKYGPIPRIFGTYKIYPTLAAQFLTYNNGSSAAGAALFVLGYGPLQVTDIEIGGSAILNYSPGVAYQVLPGDNPLTEKITIFSQGWTDIAHSTALTYNTAVNDGAQYSGAQATVEVSFLSGLYSQDSNGSRIAATVGIDVEYLDVNAVPYTVNATNSPNSGSSVTINLPDTSQAKLETFVTVASGGNSELAFVTGIVTNTSITVETLEKSYINPSITFNSWQKVLNPSGFSGDPSINATDNNPGVIKRTVSFDFPSSSDAYGIRIIRRTPTSSSPTVDTATWTNIRIYNGNPVVNPFYDAQGNIIPIAYLAVNFNNSGFNFNGQIDQISCTVTSKLPTYNGSSWTSPTPTENPAWAFAEILTGSANPLPMSKTQLDGNSLKAWADYCDQTGRQFNVVIDQDTTVPQVLSNCASAGRATVVANDGLYTAVPDTAKTTVVQHITPRNTVQGSLKIQGTIPILPHFLKMQWINPSANWQQDELDVYADGYSSDGGNGTQIGTVSEKIQLVGCTNPDQAFRDGRYRLAVAKLRRVQYTVTMDWENLACNVGDLVTLTYDTALQGLGQGRIAQLLKDGSGNITGIVLDEDQAMVLGTNYSVRIRLDDWSSQVYSVGTSPGITNELTFLTPIPAATLPAPDVGNLCQFGIQNQETLQCLVQSITYHDDFVADLTLVEYAPGVFISETEPVPAYTSGVTARPTIQTTVAPPVILSVRSDESVLIKNANGTLSDQILMTMEPPDLSVTWFEVQYKLIDAQTWTPLPLIPVAQGQVSIVGVSDGATYDIQIRNRTSDQYVSAWTTTQEYVIGKTTPPPAIQVLDAINNLLTWTYPNPPLDLAGFVVRFHNGDNTNWASATQVATVLNTQYDMTPLPGSEMTVMVAAIDTVGNVSTPAILYRNFGDPPMGNQIISYAQEPTFPGTITGGTVTGGKLYANDDGGLFWGSDDTQPFWGGLDTDNFWSESYDELQYQFSYNPDLSVGDSYNLNLTSTIKGDGYTVEYRSSGSGLFWTGNDTDLFWGGLDTDSFWGPDDAFAPWPGQINATAQRYDFLVTCPASGIIQGEIDQLDVVVNVPGIEETINNFVVRAASAPVRLPIVNTYRVIDNIQLTLNYDAINFPNALTVQYQTKDVTGPIVVVLDKNGNPTDGMIDATVRGY